MNVEQALTEFHVEATKGIEKYTVKCPFHLDKAHPNGEIHKSTGNFHCWNCKKRTTLEGFLSKLLNQPVYLIKRRLGYKTDVKQPIPVPEIELEHIRLWENKKFLEELYRRCITDDVIRRYRLGVSESVFGTRITIPIMNEVGEYVNRFYYLPGADKNKFVQMSGRDRTRARFFPIEQLEFDTILVCGGLLKAAAAAEVLNKHDIGAISPTVSENDWPNELTSRLQGKLIYVNADVDKTGEKYSELRCRIIKSVARGIHKVTFTPEMVGNLEHGDINDFLYFGGDLFKLLLETPEWVIVPGAELQDDQPKHMSFRDAFSNTNVGTRVEFTGVVTGIAGNHFDIAQEVEVTCPRDKDYCMLCDVNSQIFANNSTNMKIGKEHPVILGLIGEKDDELPSRYKKAFKIPRPCRECSFKEKKWYSVMEVRLDEQVEPTSRVEPLTDKVGWLVDGPHNLDSQAYILTGRHYPSPKNQLAQMIISNCDPTKDALDSFSPLTSENFTVFQPKEWTVESLTERLNEIYSDFEANVTRIYLRRDLHLTYDLAYHSVLHFNFGDSLDNRGWAEVLVIGDTEQGKSHIIEMMLKHYGLGFKIDSKSVTPAGLTIGLEKSYSKHFAVLGAFPKNDRKLIIFEELKGMKQETFQSLTEVRSSGFVQTTKIKNATRRARVRIIAISNPPDRREIESYSFGIESALGLIGTHEDLRRFDIVYIAGKNDIDRKLLNELLSNPPKAEHKYTDDLSQQLILKAWKCEQVEFEDLNLILSLTGKLVEKFGHGPPVLGANSSHLKVAKLAAALAARTASYSGEILIVRNCHVEYITQFLDRIYCSRSSRLDEKSRSVRDSTLLRDRKGLIEYLKSLTNAADIIVKIKETDILSSNFVRDLCGDFHLGCALFSKLIQTNAITKLSGDKYAKTPEFVGVLEQLNFEIQKPDFLKKYELGDF